MADEKKQEVQRAQPAQRALSPFEEMDRLFESAFPRSWMRPLRWEWPDITARSAFEGKMPKVDVVDRQGEVQVKAEIPGVEKKDLEISMTDNTVTIKGSTRHEEKEEKGDYYRREISTGSFSRTVALPSEVDTSRAQAKFKDGILELVIPKNEKAKRRTIQIE